MTFICLSRLGKQFSKDGIGITAETKKKYASFYVKINVKLAGVTNKDGKEVHKNIQLRFIGSWRFMSFLLHNLASNLDDD